MRGLGLAFLLLPEASEASLAGVYGTRAELSFDLIVEDLNEAQTYFQSHGVPCEGELSAGLIVVRDPDGLPIEIVQA